MDMQSDEQKRQKYDLYFAANSADHSVTSLHFTVHSILVAAIAIVLGGGPLSGFFGAIVSILGLVMTRISWKAIVRAIEYRKYWEAQVDPELFAEMYDFLNNATGERPNPPDSKSRNAVLYVFALLYVVLLVYGLTISLCK